MVMMTTTCVTVDMDYTLAGRAYLPQGPQHGAQYADILCLARALCVVYKEPVFEALTYDIALEHMVQIGYPESIRGLKVPSVSAREFESAPPCAFARG